MEPDKPLSLPLPDRSTFELFVIRLADGSVVTRRADELERLPCGATIIAGARKL